MKISKLRAALAVICVLTVSVLLVQNTLLLQQRFAMKSTAVEGETVDIDSDGVARTLSIKLGEFQADQNSLRSTSPSLFGVLQQALRDTRANSSSANLYGNHTQRHLATSFRGNPMKVPLPPVESRNLATKQQDDPLIAFKTHVDEMKRKVAEIPKPKLTEVDNEPWEALWGRDNEFHYPYYLKKSRMRLTEIPPSVSALFPIVFSNTTLMSRPPKREYSFKKFENVFTDRNVDILKLLSHWDNLDVPFYANLPRLRFDVENPPPPKVCNFTPDPKLKEKLKLYDWKRHAECSKHVRELTTSELEGNHILFTIRTTASFHKKRLPVLFHTWLTTVNRSNVAIVTDAEDPVLEYRAAEAGIKYYMSIPGYERLCEKAGDEVSLMFLPENSHYQWICHVDDDIYVNMDRLVDVLGNFRDDEPVYIGCGGSMPSRPRRVMTSAKLGKPGTPYHFAVGGMYCLSRPLLNRARRWIGGREAFQKMCAVTKEPEDVTVGFVVGVVLGLELNQTGLIHGHGNYLRTVDSSTLQYQIGIAYGYGAVKWGSQTHNTVIVPYNLFSIKQDPSQFLSLHCHCHKTVGWCLHKADTMIRKKHKPQL